MIMETEKSHNLLSASWNPGKPVVQLSLPEDLRSRSTDAWGMGEVRRGGCVDVPAQREDKFTLSSPFCFIPILRGWMVPIHIGEGHMLYSVCAFKCYSLVDTPSQTHREIMFYLLSGHRLAQSS